MCVVDNSACDNLRCTDCNFEVLRFDGRAWEGRTDYMFLRNNAPDPTKLSARLQPSAGMYVNTCATPRMEMAKPTHREMLICDVRGVGNPTTSILYDVCLIGGGWGGFSLRVFFLEVVGQ